MSTRATVLRDSRHRDFLKSQRRDPVTHGTFMTGDRVTRCARCLLPFLQESWEAIGRTHCGQTASVGLDDVEPSPVVHTKRADELRQRVPRPKAGLLDLEPIPIQLHEVSIALR